MARPLVSPDGRGLAELLPPHYGPARIEAIDAGRPRRRKRRCARRWNARVADAPRPDGRGPCWGLDLLRPGQAWATRGVAEAWTQCTERGWKRHPRRDQRACRARQLVYLLARDVAGRHSGLGRRPSKPGSFEIAEDDEKVTFHDEPVRPRASGWSVAGLYEKQGYGRTRGRRTTGPTGRRDFPLYCTHCSFMNESLADPVEAGTPLYPSDPPEDYSTDPCTWVLVQGSGRPSPRATGSGYGAVKPGVRRVVGYGLISLDGPRRRPRAGCFLTKAAIASWALELGPPPGRETSGGVVDVEDAETRWTSSGSLRLRAW